MIKNIFFELDLPFGSTVSVILSKYKYAPSAMHKMEALKIWVDINHIYPRFLTQYVKDITTNYLDSNSYYEYFRKRSSKICAYFNWDAYFHYRRLGWR